MKTYRSAGLLMALIGLLSSCSNSDSPIEPQMVDLKLDFTLSESGSMSRATGSDVYDTFYEESIKTKKLTPKTYHLVFKDKSSTQTILEIDGNWEMNNGVRLPEGEYAVSGYSRPIEPTSDSEYMFTSAPSDSVYLSFKENVTITKNMTELNLNASYDSYLLMFDAQNTESITVNILSKFLSKNNNIFWLFIKSNSYYRKGYPSSPLYYKLDIKRNNGNKCRIYLENYPFEIGKYYYFNDMTNSFDIPKMESGN